MASKWIVAVVCAAALGAAACEKKDDGENATTADTMAVPSTDTVNVPTAVPTTDTVVKTTTTEVDTIRGEHKDTTKH